MSEGQLEGQRVFVRLSSAAVARARRTGSASLTLIRRFVRQGDASTAEALSKSGWIRAFCPQRFEGPQTITGGNLA